MAHKDSSAPQRFLTSISILSRGTVLIVNGRLRAQSISASIVIAPAGLRSQEHCRYRCFRQFCHSAEFGMT
jgi:hypothetical protein